MHLKGVPVPLLIGPGLLVLPYVCQTARAWPESWTGGAVGSGLTRELVGVSRGDARVAAASIGGRLEAWVA